MELRLYDYRNCKYQGQTYLKQMKGFGILLDEKYTFIMAEWDASEIAGNFLTVFNDSMISYGNVNQCIVQNKGNLVIYINPQMYQKGQGIVVLDNVDLCVASKIQISNGKQTQSKRNEVKIIQETQYEKENKFGIISKLLNIKLSTQYKNLVDFTMKRFKTKHNELLECYQNNKSFKISFRKEGILLDLIKNSKGNFHLNSIGFMSSQNSQQTTRNTHVNFEYGRKYLYYSENKWLIQEFINSQPQTFVQFQVNKQKIGNKQYEDNENERQSIDEKSRPKQCVKNLREYYKRSLTFVNKYIKLNKIYQMKNSLSQKLENIQINLASKEAQRTLQKLQNRKNSERLTNEGGNSHQVKFNRIEEVSFQDIKKQLVKAKSKNKNGKYSHIYKQSSPYQRQKFSSPISQTRSNRYKYSYKQNLKSYQADRQSKKSLNYLNNQSPKRSIYQQLEINQSSANKYQSPSNRSYRTYLIDDEDYSSRINNPKQKNRSNYKRQYMRDQLQYEHNTNYGMNRQRSYLNQSVFKKSNNLTNNNEQPKDIGKLMNDYRHIQKQISKANPNKYVNRSKSPVSRYQTKYTYLEHVEDRKKY